MERARFTAFTLVGALLVTASGCPPERSRRPADPCEPGVSRGSDGETIGVTECGEVFHPSLRDLSAKIKSENAFARAAPSSPTREAYVTIALMVPMSYRWGHQEAERRQVLQEVQGAYAAQALANREARAHPGSGRLRVRLVLANPGSGSQHWKDVVPRLRERTASENLRMVFGFNVSHTGNLEAIGALNRLGIPVVGGPITAESLEMSPGLPRLAKVVPSNIDQARALVAHLRADPKRAFLVEDVSDKDLYAQSLRRAFRLVTRGTPYAPEQFLPEHATSNDYSRMVNNLCDSKADTVFFTGRPPALASFVSALGGRGCEERRFRLVTVSGASTLALDPHMDWAAFARGKGLEVVYATVTHQDAWTTSGAPKTGGSRDDFEKLRRFLSEERGIGSVDLRTGRTITMYDSALLSIESIQNRVTKPGEVPSLESIPEAWRRLHGPQRVRGASGWICLTGRATPYNKAVAIVRLDDRARSVRFIRLAWPEGRPLDRACREPARP
ncbi:ABC transporter substrate-binding protein [Actinomadura kijaniata]|uniref:ABC transporter substrate-binding protein n=1 Tax=Actinomadura kijaniata TaxID=46161 RepID=UPI0014726662|nr:ABC transporter substrate-binding protein [Actinomadura kijaniata]